MSDFVSGATRAHRDLLRKTLTSTVQYLASQTGLVPEAIVQEIRYWHQSSSCEWRTTPTKSDKERSFSHWKGKCQAPGCERPTMTTLGQATFHHERRGISGQHSPQNMKPFHRDGCHERLHGVVNGSFTDGSQEPAED